LFDNLDSELRGTLTFDEFFHGIKRWRWLRRVVVDLNFPNNFSVPDNYDFNTSTCVNYTLPPHAHTHAHAHQTSRTNAGDVAPGTAPATNDCSRSSPTLPATNATDLSTHAPASAAVGEPPSSSSENFVGENAQVRATLVELQLVPALNFTPARQQWQDALIRAVCSKTEPQTQPWVSGSLQSVLLWLT
jgi:hypothetical protein